MPLADTQEGSQRNEKKSTNISSGAKAGSPIRRPLHPDRHSIHEQRFATGILRGLVRRELAR